MSFPWLLYRMEPSSFHCSVCGANLPYPLPDTIAAFVAAFRTWAEPHLKCVERRGM